MLFCIDCRFLKQEKERVGPIPMWPYHKQELPELTRYLCARPRNRCPVTGYDRIVDALEERESLHQDSCGPNGKHWQEQGEESTCK